MRLIVRANCPGLCDSMDQVKAGVKKLLTQNGDQLSNYSVTLSGNKFLIRRSYVQTRSRSVQELIDAAERSSREMALVTECKMYIEFDPEDMRPEHEVWIAWGRPSETGEPKVSHYVFNTAAELEAFITGVSVSEEWREWERLDTPDAVEAYLAREFVKQVTGATDDIPGDPSEDASGGCHCGENCDRGPSQACPIEGMTVTEIEAWRKK